MGARQGFKWNRELLAYSAWLWWREWGEWPTTVDWRRADENHPAYAAVYDHYTTWDDMLSAAQEIQNKVSARHVRAVTPLAPRHGLVSV